MGPPTDTGNSRVRRRRPRRLWRDGKEHVPHSPSVHALQVERPCGIVERISVLVHSTSYSITKLNSTDVSLLEALQLPRVTDTVMVDVLPDPQFSIDGVVPVNVPIFVSALRSSVEDSEGKKAVSVLILGWHWLRREIAKQLPAVVDEAIFVTVKDKPAVIATKFSPCEILRHARARQIEGDAINRARKVVTVPQNVDHDRGVTLPLAVFASRGARTIRPGVRVAGADTDALKRGIVIARVLLEDWIVRAAVLRTPRELAVVGSRGEALRPRGLAGSLLYVVRPCASVVAGCPVRARWILGVAVVLAEGQVSCGVLVTFRIPELAAFTPLRP